MNQHGDDHDLGAGGVEPGRDLLSMWAKAPSWTFLEGVALAFGEDPRRCIRRGEDHPDVLAGLPGEAMHFVDMARRARSEGDLSEDRPIAFMRWAQTVGLRFHALWWEHVAKRDTDNLASDPKADPSTRVRETLLKMIIGMAVEQYQYDPSAKRSDAVSNIVDDLASCGVAVSDETVRKYLREATELLPGRDLKDPS